MTGGRQGRILPVGIFDTRHNDLCAKDCMPSQHLKKKFTPPIPRPHDGSPLVFPVRCRVTCLISLQADDRHCAN